MHRLALAALGFLLAPAFGHAQTWTNLANGVHDWSVGANWTGGAAPNSGSITQLVFPASGVQTYIANNNIVTVNPGNRFDLNRITFNNSGTGTITLSGNPLSFAGTTPAIFVNGAGTAVIQNPVNLAGLTQTAGAGAGRLEFAGGLTGAFQFSMNHPGTLAITNGGTIGILAGFRGTTEISGAAFSVTQGAIGLTSGSPANSSAIVNGTTLTATSQWTIGQDAGVTATMTVNNGALVTTPIQVVGQFAGSNGMVTVTGANSRYNTSGGANQMVVGFSGTGEVVIQSGASSSAGTSFIANNAGSVGSLTVEAGGSATTVNLQAGVTAAAGPTPAANGTVRVTGAGASYSVTGTTGTSTAIGVGGVGQFLVESGATALLAGDTRLGLNASGNGTMIVDAAVANVATAAGSIPLAVGVSGAGNLTVRNGGTLTVGPVGGSTQIFAVGVNSGSTGLATVTGANSVLAAPNIVMSGQLTGAGTGGNSTLNVTLGGRIDVLNQANIGQDGPGQAVFTVDGMGSQFRLTGNGTTGQIAQLQVGRNSGSNGRLVVQGGGSVIAGTAISTSSGSIVALGPGSTGAIEVTGAGSVFSTPNIQIGGVNMAQGGTGTVSVANGGSAIAGRAVLLYNSGSINIDPSSFASAGSPGNTAGALRVNSGGFLFGMGPTTGGVHGNLQVTSGGTIIPGHPGIGEITVAGNATLETGSIFRVQLAGLTDTPANRDTLSVSNLLNFTTGANIDIGIIGSPGFVDGNTYTYTIGVAGSPVLVNGLSSGPGSDLTNILLTSSSPISASLFSLNRVGNTLVLNYQPVVEPEHVLFVGSLALGAWLTFRRTRGVGPRRQITSPAGNS